MLQPSLGLLLRFWENVKQNVFTFGTSLEDVKISGDITSRMCSTRISKTSPFSESDLKLAIVKQHLLRTRDHSEVWLLLLINTIDKLGSIVLLLLMLEIHLFHRSCNTPGNFGNNKHMQYLDYKGGSSCLSQLHSDIESKVAKFFEACCITQLQLLLLLYLIFVWS